MLITLITKPDRLSDRLAHANLVLNMEQTRTPATLAPLENMSLCLTNRHSR